MNRSVQLLQFLILGGLALLLSSGSTYHPISLLTSRHDLTAAGLGQDWNEEQGLDSPFGDGGIQGGTKREKLGDLGDKGKGLIQGRLLKLGRRQKEIEAEGLEFAGCRGLLLAENSGR